MIEKILLIVYDKIGNMNLGVVKNEEKDFN